MDKIRLILSKVEVDMIQKALDIECDIARDTIKDEERYRDWETDRKSVV